MSKRKRRVFSREFKLSVVERMSAGESAAALSRELRVPDPNRSGRAQNDDDRGARSKAADRILAHGNRR